MSFLLLAISASFALFPAFKRNSQRVKHPLIYLRIRAKHPLIYLRIRAKQHVITQRYRSTLFLLNIILHIRKIRIIIRNSYNAYLYENKVNKVWIVI